MSAGAPAGGSSADQTGAQAAQRMTRVLLGVVVTGFVLGLSFLVFAVWLDWGP